jgi:hypothetical protein
MVNLTHELLLYATYFAPRGEKRLMDLGSQIAQRYLSPQDRLIGVIGSPGAGKSLLIKGMFPGLELTNDDNGVNIRPLPLITRNRNSFFDSHTYHVDINFESAFTPISQLAEAVERAVNNGKRVVVEHFEVLFPFLHQNADIIVGVGEEVIVTRPNVFGPLPQDVANVVHHSLIYRKMAHTAEDLSILVLEQIFDYDPRMFSKHGDVRHGFVIQFEDPPKIDIPSVEQEVLRIIEQNMPVCFEDENHIRIGEARVMHCTGPRIHVENTGEIINFRLLKDIRYDRQSNMYFLTGFVGEKEFKDINNVNTLHLDIIDV